jgi:acetylornithine deacetylase
MLVQLATLKPKLKTRVVVVFIVDEEAGGKGEPIGVDALAHKGLLDSLKNGPMYWVDCAGGQPNIGSGGMIQWRVTAQGKSGHSGFPHKNVNALGMCNDAVREIQRVFYEAFPKHAKEDEYGFECSSSMKPTRTRMNEGASLNQIPHYCVIEGDIRLIPFYRITDAVKVVEEAAKKINENRNAIANRGPDSKYTLEGHDEIGLKFEVLCAPVDGLACKLDSNGFAALRDCTSHVYGCCKPLADTGTLPLVAELQNAGFDLQTIGYGDEDSYHGDNEFALLSEYKKGFKVLTGILSKLNM